MESLIRDGSSFLLAAAAAVFSICYQNIITVIPVELEAFSLTHSLTLSLSDKPGRASTEHLFTFCGVCFRLHVSTVIFHQQWQQTQAA